MSFNGIAPVYNLFFPLQYRYYRRILRDYRGYLTKLDVSSVLDLGSGTGALAAAFRDEGFMVTATDRSVPMLRYAQRRGISSAAGDGTATLPFKDNSFDLVTAAFVAHGMESGKRGRLYREAGRCAEKGVLFQDFNDYRHPLIDCIERFEGSDYFNFIHAVPEEMEQHFSSVRVVPVSSFLSWYLCLL